MKELIKSLLRLDLLDEPQDYEMMLFGMWSRWCESFTTSQLEYQKLISSPELNSWYLTELAKLELKFVQECATSPKASRELIRESYNEITFHLFNIRPSALLKEVKKSKTASYMSLHGIKVETKIFNQN
jgi:hypothetical protein